MNPTSQDLKDLLVAAGMGTFAGQTGWGIYLGREPERPDTTITLIDTGGLPPNPAWRQDSPSLYIRVRGDKGDYISGYAKALEIRRHLLGLHPQSINGTYYVGVWALGDIAFISWDDNNRPIFTLNFSITREPTDEDNRSPL